MASQRDYYEFEQLEVEVEQTTTPKRQRRGGPRSRLVEAIALMLLARPMRAAEIAQALGYPTRYVSSYLSYWKTRGLFEYVNGYWQLTPEGEEFARQVLERESSSRASHYIALAQTLVRDEQVRPTINDKRNVPTHGYSQKPLSFLASLTGQHDKKQQKSLLKCLYTLIDLLQLPDEEKEVLQALARHYAQWGSTYLYLDQLEKLMDADPTWLLQVLRSLQAKKLIYIYNDKRLGTRVGLSKQLRDSFQLCRPD